MRNIHIIAASAGSGKTWRLAEVLEQRVLAGGVRPDGVLATTFTRQAAAELTERIRLRLLGEGRVDEAHRLQAARIGTVHSVCDRLLSDFAMELGLSPRLRVLDERLASEALRRCLSQVVSERLLEELSGLRYRLTDAGFEWEQAVLQVVNLARVNRLTGSQFEDCARRSMAGCRLLLGPPAEDGAALDRALEGALRSFVKGFDYRQDRTKKTARARRLIERCWRTLKWGRTLKWADWVRLTKIDVGQGSLELAAPILDAAGQQDRHPGLHQDLCRAIELTFTIARQALHAYDTYKTDRGVVDFIDQELYALDLLEQPAVRERLGEELDLVLVDEFQDTNPIQLAIFLQLARIAGESVWVGDQKQAIFGFRGTDPALMDATIAQILAGREPETLPQSWRSRPDLVRLTSAVFAPAFGAHGIPASRVRLRPALKADPAGLGPVVERWELDAGNRREDASALAAAVSEFLDDPQVAVRDPERSVVRPLEPGDVAILCLTNKVRRQLARELEARGIRALLPRSGLLDAPEVAAVLAGLRLWVDPKNALAAAELARLAAYPPDGQEWIDDLFGPEGSGGFFTLPLARRILEARDANPGRGPLGAFDAVLTALDGFNLALRWGDGVSRQANLDALRGHVVRFTELAAAEGMASTPAALMAYLESLAACGEDTRAFRSDSDAVVVSTWHAAKGLEWPVTVLFNLSGPWEHSALGARVLSDRQGFDLRDPLAERWVRFWPCPYHPRHRGTPFHQRLDQQPSTARIQEAGTREHLRLLYVGWTRARDRLIFAGRPGEMEDGWLQLFRGPDGPLVGETAEPLTTWAGCDFETIRRQAQPAPSQPRSPEPGKAYVAAGPRSHLPARIFPSALHSPGAAGEPIRIGPPIPLAQLPDIDMGQAIHGFLAADLPGLTDAERRTMARELLAAYAVDPAVLEPSTLLELGNRFRQWIGRRWAGARWHRECPLRHRLNGGTVVRGVADLVLELETTIILIDHKAIVGSRAGVLELAAGYWGQLKAYAEAVAAATGQPVSERFVHCPLMGLVIPLEPAVGPG